MNGISSPVLARAAVLRSISLVLSGGLYYILRLYLVDFKAERKSHFITRLLRRFKALCKQNLIKSRFTVCPSGCICITRFIRKRLHVLTRNLLEILER